MTFNFAHPLSHFFMLLILIMIVLLIKFGH
jgi:hypothetical protein